MVLLTKEDLYTFGLYLELVYRGSLSLEQAGTTKYDAITVAKNYLVLADIYVIADILVDRQQRTSLLKRCLRMHVLTVSHVHGLASFISLRMKSSMLYTPKMWKVMVRGNY
jgi:hypothetical protein